MSIIVIKKHNENISSITKHLSEVENPFLVNDTTKLHPKTYKKNSSLGLKQKGSHQKETSTFPDPCDYLKTRTGHPPYHVGPKNFIKHECVKKPKLFPTQEDIDGYEEKKLETIKKRPNYVVENIATVLKLTPKVPETRVVIDRKGTTKNLCEGLQPIHIFQETFGKTPLYLSNLIHFREKMHQMRKDAIGVEKPKCRYIRRHEREELLKGLKHNWAELQHVYQGLPIMTDTIPKIMRKSKLETELKQLEKDIVLVERHPYIYVYNEDTL